MMKRMRPTAQLILASALLLTAGCLSERDTPPTNGGNGPIDRHVTVRATLHDGVLEIDKDFHDTELVKPGGKIGFACDCDEGLEFTVSEPWLYLNIDVLEGLVDAEAEEMPDAGLRALQVRLHEAREWLAQREAPLQVEAGGDEGGDPVEIVQTFVDLFGRMAPEDSDSSRLLPEWPDPPPGFVPGDQQVGPFVVGPVHGLSIWKFSWIVRVREDPDNVLEWDPHLIGSRDY